MHTKAKEIQWRYTEELKHLVVRMGGFHVALNFLSVIEKNFQENGLEDLLIESDIYGSNFSLALLKGKSYNRDVRAHKLVMEALLSLQWQWQYGEWIAKKREDEQLLGAVDVDQVESNLTMLKTTIDEEERKEALHVLFSSTENLRNLFDHFKRKLSPQLF